jgi:hypothetical protein
VTGPNEGDIDQAIKDIGKKFNITSQIKVKDFLGVKIERNEKDGTIRFYQPDLIESIIKDVGLQSNNNSRVTPAVVNKILHKFKGSPDHQEDWHYRSVIGKLNYLEKCTRPDIAYAVHRCARFS